MYKIAILGYPIFILINSDKPYEVLIGQGAPNNVFQVISIRHAILIMYITKQLAIHPFPSKKCLKLWY